MDPNNPRAQPRNEQSCSLMTLDWINSQDKHNIK